MKKYMRKVMLALSLILALGALLQFRATIVHGAPVDTVIQEGFVKEGNNYRYYQNGILLKNTWRRIEGKKYYFKSSGNAATYSYKVNGKYYVFNQNGQLMTPKKKAIVKVGSRKYYVTSKGRPIPGWHVLKSKLYYVYKSGRCATNTKKEDVTFSKNGYAKNNSVSKARIKAMQTIDRITNSKMSRREKLRACFNHVMLDCQYVGTKFPKNYKHMKSGWYYTMAYDTLKTKRCNCYGYASTFAVLAKVLGYKPYIIEGNVASGAEHCFVIINGGYYDNIGKRFGTPSRPPYTVRKRWKV